jgi:hypothetical protein
MAGSDTHLIGWGIARPQKDAGKRMCTFHQQLENEHCQPKEVVLRSPVKAGEKTALQFGWRKLRFADRATVHRPIMGFVDLKGIGVHQRHQGGVGNQDIGLIHIANDVPAGVQGAHCCGEIVSRAVQIAIVEQRTPLATR